MLLVARGGEWAGRRRRRVSFVAPRSRALCTTRFYGYHAHTQTHTQSLRTITAVILRLWAFRTERLSCTWGARGSKIHERVARAHSERKRRDSTGGRGWTRRTGHKRGLLVGNGMKYGDEKILYLKLCTLHICGIDSCCWQMSSKRNVLCEHVAN